MEAREAGDAGLYHWGAGCLGWRLLETPELQVREEAIPPGASEVLHLHRRARQLFYVIAGELTLRGVEETIRLGPGDSCVVPPGEAHEARNEGAEPARFLVVSSPSTNGDRIELAMRTSESACGPSGAHPFGM